MNKIKTRLSILLIIANILALSYFLFLTSRTVNPVTCTASHKMSNDNVTFAAVYHFSFGIKQGYVKINGALFKGGEFISEVDKLVNFVYDIKNKTNYSLVGFNHYSFNMTESVKGALFLLNSPFLDERIRNISFTIYQHDINTFIINMKDIPFFVCQTNHL